MFSFLNYPNPIKKNVVVVKVEFIDIPQKMFAMNLRNLEKPFSY